MGIDFFPQTFYFEIIVDSQEVVKIVKRGPKISSLNFLCYIFSNLEISNF